MDLISQSRSQIRNPLQDPFPRRDLIYTDKLVKAYHTDERVMMTLQLAEKCGIDALLTNPSLGRIMNKYWHEAGGKIKFISDCGAPSFHEGIKMSEKAGAVAMYCQGEMSDRLVQKGQFDVITKGLELIRSYGKPAGIGAHLIETIQACVAQGIKWKSRTKKHLPPGIIEPYTTDLSY